MLAPAAPRHRAKATLAAEVRTPSAPGPGALRLDPEGCGGRRPPRAGVGRPLRRDRTAARAGGARIPLAGGFERQPVAGPLRAPGATVGGVCSGPCVHPEFFSQGKILMVRTGTRS